MPGFDLPWRQISTLARMEPAGRREAGAFLVIARSQRVPPWAGPMINSATKQSISHYAEPWIASRSLSSGPHSRDPLARNDGRDGGAFPPQSDRVPRSSKSEGGRRSGSARGCAFGGGLHV